MPNPKLLFLACGILLSILFSCAKEEGEEKPLPSATLSIEGKITDPGNNLIQGAQLILTSATGAIKRSNSSDMGVYTFQDLDNGTYTLAMVEPWGGTVTNKSRNITFSGTKLTENFTMQMKNQTGFPAFQYGDKFSEIKTLDGTDNVTPSTDIGALTVWSSPKITTPIKDVNGKQLKGSDWLKASATCEATCNGAKAIFKINMKGLVPNGAYTMWLVELTEHHNIADGFPRSTIKDSTPLKSGGTHLFKAGADGTFNYTGETSSCVLTTFTNGLAIFASYEMDGKAEQSRSEKNMNANDQNDATHLFIFY